MKRSELDDVNAKLHLLNKQQAVLDARRKALTARRADLLATVAREAACAPAQPLGHPRTWTAEDWRAFLRPYTYGYQVERALNLPLKVVTGYLDAVGVPTPWRRRGTKAS